MEKYLSKDGLEYLIEGLDPRYAKERDLADVAKSGSYDDLTDKPSIPSTPGDIDAMPASTTLADLGGIALTEKGANSGVAPLNAGGKIDSQYLPSYVDDVIECYVVDGYEAFSANWLSKTDGGYPLLPEGGKIYVVLSSGDYLNKVYRWGGTAYVNIGGDVDLSAYATQTWVQNQGYLTSHQDISGKADSSSLASVATSGDYTDLTNTPTIPTIPTNVSSFINDAGYLTSHQDISGKANSADLATVATSGDYTDLINKPIIPSIPSNVSAFTNDAGYLTQHQSLSGYATETWVGNQGFLTSHQDISGKVDSSSLATVATSGDYDDLINKPTIPSAYTLPTASTSVLGGVKVDGTSITIDDGVISAANQGATYTAGYGIDIDGNNVITRSKIDLNDPVYYLFNSGLSNFTIGVGNEQNGNKVSAVCNSIEAIVDSLKRTGYAQTSAAFGYTSVSPQQLNTEFGGTQYPVKKMMVDGSYSITSQTFVYNSTSNINSGERASIGLVLAGNEIWVTPNGLSGFKEMLGYNLARTVRVKPTNRPNFDGQTILENVLAKLDTAISSKQGQLTAGTGISINNDVISASGSSYTAGTGIDITNGVISFDDVVLNNYVPKTWDDGGDTSFSIGASMSPGFSVTESVNFSEDEEPLIQPINTLTINSPFIEINSFEYDAVDPTIETTHFINSLDSGGFYSIREDLDENGSITLEQRVYVSNEGIVFEYVDDSNEGEDPIETDSNISFDGETGRIQIVGDPIVTESQITPLLDANISSLPTDTDGTYILLCEINDGEASSDWVPVTVGGSY